jgi:predicted secreted protein
MPTPAGSTGIGLVLTAASTAIANIFNIGGPSMSRNTIDNTTFDTVGGFRTFFTGLRDGGTVTFDVIFTKAGYTTLLGHFNTAAAIAYTLTMPATADAAVISFSGMVTDMPLTVPLDDKITVSVTIKVIGAVTIAA